MEFHSESNVSTGAPAEALSEGAGVVVAVGAEVGAGVGVGESVGVGAVGALLPPPEPEKCIPQKIPAASSKAEIMMIKGRRDFFFPFPLPFAFEFPFPFPPV